jgi:16S rRNA (uracil1498-N3)-methyltransferase
MPLFFIRSSDVKNGSLIISGELFNHIKNALRYKVDDPIEVVDEEKTAYQAIITRISNQVIEGKIIQKVPAGSPLFPPLILAQALVKKKKMETLLEKAAELGVSEIVPLTTERTVVLPREERWEHQKDRWEKIVLEASQQSEQPAPPKIHEPVEFQSFLQKPRSGTGFIFWEKETLSFKKSVSSFLPFQPGKPITLIIGPEGGFHQNEIELSREKGYISLSLGRQKLRSETAVMVAITLLQYELGYFGQ